MTLLNGRFLVPWILLVLAAFLFLGAGDAIAGPGGEVIEAVFKTKIGRILLIIAAVVFLPLLLYVVIRQKIGERRTMKDLEALAEDYPHFAWGEIEKRVANGAQRLYGSWTSGDISRARDYLTDDYFQSQQEILDRWKEEGKRNVCRLEMLKKVRPLLVRTETSATYSMVAVLLTMDVVDYMEDVRTGKVLKGRKRANTDHDSIWIMIYDGVSWRLHAIEDGSNSLVMAAEKNEVNQTHLRSYGQAAPAPALHPAPSNLSQKVPSEEIEAGGVQQPEDEQYERQPEDDKERPE